MIVSGKALGKNMAMQFDMIRAKAKEDGIKNLS